MFSQLAATTSYTVGVHNLPYCSFDICAIVINAIVIINFLSNKKIHTLVAKMFYVLVGFSLVAAIFNLLGVMQSVFDMPQIAKDLFHVFYSGFYAFAVVVFFIYVVNLIRGDEKQYVWCRVVAVVLLGIECVGFVLNVLSVFKIAAISNVAYVAVIYGGQLLSVCGAEAFIVKNFKKLNLVQRINVHIFGLINAFGAVWQLLLAFGAVSQQIQLSCFALSVAVLLAYVTLQRPEDDIDSVSGMFNFSRYLLRTKEKIHVGKSLVAFVFEISNMAIVNATFGIKGGNDVIKELATRIRKILPKKLYLFRMNGARFVINFNSEEQYREFEPKFKDVFEQPVEVNQTVISVSFMGCLVPMPEITDQVSELEEILKYYRAVSNSSDKVLVADREAVEKSLRRKKVEYAIQNALKTKGFEVYYQPIYSVEERRISSCEALIRLKDAELGFIGPDEFIPVAEETGRIVEIGRFVMEEVCRFIKEDCPQRYGIDFIDVNLSVIQCMHPEIIDDINAVLLKYGIPKSMVNLEVTETASAKSYALLQSRLSELHRSGFTISLDDFGSGFSSVEYLINFPFDIVKLDKGLVWAYMSTEKYEPILRHYMPMLHGLGVKIVAEGVETKEMLVALEELGCDYIQGYYFSRPVCKADFIEYVKKAATEGLNI